MRLLEHTPGFDSESAAVLAEKLYGITAVAAPLPSERDQNFLLVDNAGEKFVLKIANALEERGLLEAQNAVLDHLDKRISFSPKVIPATSNDLITTVESPIGSRHFVRLVSYLPGVPLAEIEPRTNELLHDFGEKLGQLHQSLSDFDHLAFHRDFHWDLAKGPGVVAEFATLISDEGLRRLVSRCANYFSGIELSSLPRSVIHGDANNYNVLVDPGKRRVVGLIDFGDMVYSYTVGDLAVAIAYVVLDTPDPIGAASSVVAGYTRQCALSEVELSVLWRLVVMRLCMSVCLAAVQQQMRPDNEYLDISQRSIRESLPRLVEILECGGPAPLWKK